MAFISLILALLLEQQWPLRNGNALHTTFTRYVQHIAYNFNAGRARDGMIAWFVVWLPIVIVALAVSIIAHHVSGLLVLVWNVFVLYLVFGFRQFSNYYGEIMQALKRDDLAAARERLAAWRGQSAQTAFASEMPADEIARVAIELGVLSSHRYVFSIVAWFIVAGPAGALGYRVAALLVERWNVQPQSEMPAFGQFAARVFEVIDWAPVRLTALSFAIAGDFMGAVESWRENAAQWMRRDHGIVLASAAGALGVKLGGVIHGEAGIEDRPVLGDGDEADVQYMQAGVGLVWRALVLWLFLILLVTVASWF